MRDPNRIQKILAEIQAIWEKYPDLRLGQLIINVDSDPYYTEDEDLIQKMKQFYSRLDQDSK